MPRCVKRSATWLVLFLAGCIGINAGFALLFTHAVEVARERSLAGGGK